MTASQPALAQPPTSPPPAPQPRRTPGNLEVLIVTVLLLIAGAYVAARAPSKGANWILELLILFVFTLCLGRWICGRPLGILVTERNLMSLSRFQLILWTLLVLSAFAVIAVQRIRAGIPQALSIEVDWHLWALLGISTASLVGTPLLLASKKDQNPAVGVVDKAAKVLNENSGDINTNRLGRLYSNTDPKDARLTDIFQGDEVINTAYIDPAKLQMFLFTLIVAGSYAYQIYRSMSAAPANLAMPAVSPDMIALLGISHAGYLGSKTAG